MISLRPSVNATEAYLQLSYDETQQLRWCLFKVGKSES
jgi:hypothetical protein